MAVLSINRRKEVTEGSTQQTVWHHRRDRLDTTFEPRTGGRNQVRRRRNNVLAVLLLTAAWLAPWTAAMAQQAKGKVNINSATAEQLSLLPRVGEVVAARIIEFRDKNGRFKAPEDLMLIKGIGEKTFELLEPYVSVTGETTLSEKVSTEADA